MNPKDGPAAMPDTVARFLDALKTGAYQGDILTSHADRLMNATDNSIYQVMPQAVLAPRVQKDLNIIMELGAQDDFADVRFMPRGGGTGTNGQSLNNCVIIDTGKYLTRIININAAEGYVRCEPGVVLDQLNAALKSYGMVFPVHISTSKSCTLGGMVSTDACGKGSRVYGKTSDYCLSLTCLLANGREIETKSHANDALANLIKEQYDAIRGSAPDLPRGLSAYDLLGTYESGVFDMTRLIAGSEGSLAVLKEIKLKIVPKVERKSLVSVLYGNFDTALRHVSAILEHDPVAIETIDDHILDLARGDILWHDLKAVLSDYADPAAVKAIHFVEFENDDADLLQNQCEVFEEVLAGTPGVLGYITTTDPKTIQSISSLRSKCVGLLGNMDGNRRPVPFMEDTAVPPDNLADYISDLKAMLAKHDLVCGIFGHSDAGCLHVRPALDLRLTDDEKFIRILSDDVVALVKKHGGVLWGEHGKGMRGEYTEALAGTLYYKVMQDIKSLLDPHNKLNPGKIAGPDIKKIDDVPMRGAYDRQISPQWQEAFPKATQCNGNGLCFSAMPDDTMCPSYKITKDRKHSPKGRAAILREWIRLKSTDAKAARAFSHEVRESLHGCLSCKACTSTCPIHVNIPDMKIDFLDEYYKSKHRPYRDYLTGRAELYAQIARFIPFVPTDMFGLKDIPKPCRPSLKTLMRKNGFHFATPHAIKHADNPVLIVQDAYTSFYEAQTVLSVLQILRKIGYEPLVLPFRQSGKSWHVRGFKEKFRHIALGNIAFFENKARFGIPMVGIDPSTTLIYRDEYSKILGKKPRYSVLLLQEFLSIAVQDSSLPKIQTIPQSVYPLFLHCTEKTMKPQSADEWSAILKAFNINVEIIQTGCCGMAGIYGHEAEHADYSEGLYDLSWKGKINETALVTGYSCRSQIKRLEGFHVKHPLELLNELL